MNKDLKIAALGGGTGLSMLLKGLRGKYGAITAIVSVADDGGSSGILRREYSLLPPGDIRNCISALANDSYPIEQFLNYRFTDGSLKGHAVGNLILTALNNMCGDFEKAVDMACKLFGTDGRVVPVSGEDIVLNAYLTDGSLLVGESNVGAPYENKANIDRVFLTPEKPSATEYALKAIDNADAIILGPGSLYTSIIPNLLVDGIAEAIKRSNAKKIYVCNIMTQPGETDGYTAYDHLNAIEKHTYPGIIDNIIVNSQEIPHELEQRYREAGAAPVLVDEEKFSGKSLIKARMLVMHEDKVRHSFARLARAISVVINEL